MRRLRPGLRGRLVLAVAIIVGAVLVVGAVALNLVVHDRLIREADGTLDARASAALADLSFDGTRIVVQESSADRFVDGHVWVFQGGRMVEGAPAPPAAARAVRSLAGGPRRRVDPGGHQRLYAVPIERGERRLGTVVATVNLKAFDRTERTVLVASLVLSVLLLLAVIVSAWWALGRALRPVASMTALAAEWSEHDVDRRFGLGRPRDELTQLAATLDDLLARLAAGMRREQRFSAELSHELRTPIARVRSEAELALRQDRAPTEYRAALESIVQTADRMTATVETLVDAARAEAGPRRGTADAEEIACRAAESAAPAAAGREVRIDVGPPPRPLRVGVDEDLVERILVPVVENGCRHGAGTVTIAIEPTATDVRFLVGDDGPGVAAADRERIFEPGVRGARTDGAAEPGGAGLGLALARRLARSAGGDISAEPSAHGGRFAIRLPAG